MVANWSSTSFWNVMDLFPDSWYWSSRW
jgi:hypothetical protein